MKRSVTIPHLTGGNNNKVIQVIEWMQSLNNPVFMDSKGNHLPHQQIVEMYDEASTPSNNRPIVKVFCETNETEYVRNNPTKPGKRKTAARDKYMANLLGGKNGNDLLNLAAKVGSRKAAVEILKSGSTKTPFNVEIPFDDEDGMNSLKMQGLTPSTESLVDEGFRSKLEGNIKSFLGEENVDSLAELDKGVLITDEGIEDFRQMMTVYHLTHQMNGPLANSIKGHVPRKYADLFDRLIPTFDDILAGENLVLFASSIKKRPKARNLNFELMRDADTLLPSWLTLAQPHDDALRELRENLGEREVESGLAILASGDFFGAFNSVLSSIRAAVAWPLITLFRINGADRQSDRQARLFDDLNENITDSLVADYGRGRGYTNRKELAKAVMHSTSESYDRRLTDLFSPLRITVNAARRVRSFSKSGVPVEMTVDLNTFDAGDVKGTDATATIGPGMYYIGNFDFRIPPIGWNRKWMNATAQIVHEYWQYIRPSGTTAANAAFMPTSDDKSLNLPQILYLIAIRTKELYNYDLAPEEWMTLIKVLGGQNALTENYYSTNATDILGPLRDFALEQQVQTDALRQAMSDAAQTSRRARRMPATKRNPTNDSALPHVYTRSTTDMKGAIEAYAKQISDSHKMLIRLTNGQKNAAKYLLTVKGKKLEKSNKKLANAQKLLSAFDTEKEEAEKLKARVNELEEQVEGFKLLELTMETGGAPKKVVDVIGDALKESLFESHKIIGVDGLHKLVKRLDIPEPKGGWPKKQPLHKIIINHINGVMTDDPEAEELLELVEEVVTEKVIEVEEKVEELADSDLSEKAKEIAEMEAKIDSMPDKGDDGIVDHGDPDEDDDADDADGDAHDDGGGVWSDPTHPPMPENPILNLGDTGQVVIIGDTHGDYVTNEKVLKHISSNYPDAKVVWNGDKVDGRHSDYTPGEDDRKNLNIINGLMMKNPKKYFTTQGNHERFLLSGFSPAGFWNTLTPEQQLQYEKQFAEQPVIVTAGPALIVHGGLPVGKTSEKPSNFQGKPISPFKPGWLKNKNAWNRHNVFATLWTRPDPDDYPNMYSLQKPLALAAGYNVLITGHTPAIGYQKYGDKPFFNDPDFLAVSAQTTEAYEATYIVLDLDNDKLIVEAFNKKTTAHENTFTHEFPPAIARRNPGVPMYVGTPTGRVKNLGSITAIVQVGRNIIKDVGEGIQDIYRSMIGGRQSMTEKRMAMAVAEMQADLERECLELGGNAVGNIQIDYEYPPTSGDITLIAVADAFKTPKKNPASDYHKYEKKVITILKKEDGATSLKSLRPAFPKGTTKAKVVGMLQKMNHVVLHQDGDYILMQGISNPPFDLPEKQKQMDNSALEDTLKLLPEWAETYVDRQVKSKMASSPAGTKFYEIVIGTEGSESMNRMIQMLPAQKLVTTMHKGRSNLNLLSDELGRLYNTKVTISLSPSGRFTLKIFARPSGKQKKGSNFQKGGPRKNPEHLCIYKKSPRSKPCGSPLREKKNPKGRYVCRKCGAEYEIR